MFLFSLYVLFCSFFALVWRFCSSLIIHVTGCDDFISIRCWCIHLSHALSDNKFGVESTCHLIPSLLNKPQFSKIHIGHLLSACVRHEAWQRNGLPVPPDEVVRRGWEAVLDFLRAGPTVAVHELRLPSLVPTSHPMSFTQKLQLVLDTASTLPLHVDLGEYSCSWENGEIEWAQSEQPGFRKLTRDELLQLMRRLHAAPHAVLLNLQGQLFLQGFDTDVMQEMAVHMTALSKLQVLDLSCECPPPYPYSILHAHVRVTAAATTTTISPTALESFDIFVYFDFIIVSCDANFVVIMNSTPPPPCTIAAAI
jgi:hypothetical protein